MEINLPYDFEPRRYQKRLMAYLDNGGTRAAGVWHRRAGKDITMLNQTCKMAHERKAAYWHCLPTYRQAKKAIWDGFTSDGKRIIDSVFPPSVVKRRNESEMLLELRCGSIVQLVGSDTIDNLVGAGPAGVTFSEFSICKPNSWDLVRPMLRENNGWAAFIFTPRGNNHAKKLFDISQKTKGWYSELLTIEDTGALSMSTLDEERAAGMPEALIRQEYLCDFTAALVGAVYGDLLEALEKKGGLNLFEHERDGVFVNFDLGIGDATSMWFWRHTANGVDFIDYHEASGKPMSYYFDLLELRSQELGFGYVKFFLPHDARQRSWQTGVSIVDQFIERFGSDKVAMVPSMSFADGIQAGRWMLQQETRFHPRCVEGVETLKQYHYEYDESRRTFSSKPEHDWSSHGADAYRYSALVVRAAGRIYKKKEVKPEPVKVKSFNDFTLDELWELQETSKKRERV